MRHPLRIALLVVVALLTMATLSAPPALAQPIYGRGGRDLEVTGSLTRAPWGAPYEYDSGSDNDKHPSRPYYQQGRGQQTGGTARNLIPGDGLNLSPR